MSTGLLLGKLLICILPPKSGLPECRTSTISWWMLDLWFGLDASGFDKASKHRFLGKVIRFKCSGTNFFLATFHPVFGPILMVTYACLSNTLLLTGEFVF